MAIGAFLTGLTRGVSEGLGDVQQVQQITAQGRKQAAQDEMSRYASDALKNNTDPMDFAQNMYALSVKAGDQQAASHWYGAYSDQKQIKTNHALIGAYTAADQKDPGLSASYFNQYAHLAGLPDKAEVVPHVGPDGTETQTIALTGPDGRKTVLPADSWHDIAKGRLAIELSDLHTQQMTPYQQRLEGAQAGATEAQGSHITAMTPVDVNKGVAETGNIQAQTETERQKPGLVRAQTGLVGAQGAEVRATTPGKVALLGAQTGETNAQAGYLGEQAKTVAAMRDPNVTKAGAETIGTLADANYKDTVAQNARMAQPSDIAAKESEAERNRATAGYYDRGGAARATGKPQAWSKEDQSTMDDAISAELGMGTDFSGQPVKTGEPTYPELGKPYNQRAMASVTQGLMTANPELRNNAAGAARLAAAIIAHKAVSVPKPGTNEYVVSFGGMTYRLPAAAPAGAGQISASGAGAGPTVPFQR
jgi:hypothetical protein